MGSVSTREAQCAYKGQLKWANMLRPNYCKKGRDFAGAAFPVFYIKEADSVTKDDILQEMKKLGAEISYPTLNRYVKAGLVTEPDNVNMGRGKGKISQYPTHALFETWAAWELLNGGFRVSKSDIKQARENKSNYQSITRMFGENDRCFYFWVTRVMLAYMAWRYKELKDILYLFTPEIGPKYFAAYMTIEAPSYDDDENKISELLKEWTEGLSDWEDGADGKDPDEPDEQRAGNGDFLYRYYIAKTRSYIRVYERDKAGEWKLHIKEKIGDILNMA